MKGEKEERRIEKEVKREGGEESRKRVDER